MLLDDDCETGAFTEADLRHHFDEKKGKSAAKRLLSSSFRIFT